MFQVLTNAQGKYLGEGSSKSFLLKCHKCNEAEGGGSGDRMGTHDHHHFKGTSKENNTNNKKNRMD